MAKTSTAKAVVSKSAETKDVSLVSDKSLTPDFIEDADYGQGVSSSQEDNLVPLIYILQPLSPVCQKNNSAYIKGAEPGMFWLRNSPDPIANGEDGIQFQPCYFAKAWIEWVPRKKGGGFVARHTELPKDAIKEEDEDNPNRVKWVRPNGNELIETRSHSGFVLGRGAPQPYVISLQSTGHTASRAWMFLMNSFVNDKGKVIPSYARKYLLKTKHRSNTQGEWYMLEAHDGGWLPRADYERGKALFNAFHRGEKVEETPDQQEASTGSASSGSF